ncbi:MAG: iron transporter [Syntrophaceae bacterium]
MIRKDPNLVRDSFVAGLKKGLSGFIWIMKIVIPVSFLTALLAWSGFLIMIDFIVQPVMGLLYLPAMAALPLIIGMLAGIYGGIAAMAILPFTYGQMILMANFLLIAHNMIQEGIIQSKSGLPAFRATVIRIGTACITVIILAQFLDVGTAGPASPGANLPEAVPFTGMLKSWAMETAGLALKIFLIIMTILSSLEVVKALGWINTIVKFLTPFLRVMGLSEKVGLLWITAVVFGLAYGGAVIVEEARAGHLDSEELETLQLSIGINHSMVEDPSLFLSLGLSPFWLWVPRTIIAIIAVRILTFWKSGIRRKT